MSGLQSVSCGKCGTTIYRSTHRINENVKLGHNFYCSRACEYQYKMRRQQLACDNSFCRRIFIKIRSQISRYNYCSRSCAATVNNRKFPKRGPGFRICANPHCLKKFGGINKYCSMGCFKIVRGDYTKDELIRLINIFARRLKRTPLRRELDMGPAKACANLFGSWNKAIVAAGLQPHRSHDHRMYKRMNTIAKDGHLCDSISEAIIDNWLSENNILHKKDVQYPITNHKADWVVNGGKMFVEYFGLANDSPRYDESIKEKKNLCRKIGIELIGIYPSDLYPENRLREKLSLIKR